MLRTLYNVSFQTFNPSYLTGIAPGGAGTTQNAAVIPNEYFPFVGLPQQEVILGEFLDNPQNGIYNVITQTPQGSLVALNAALATGNQGAANWSINPQVAAAIPKWQFGSVSRLSDKTADPAGFATAIQVGPAPLQLCTTGANAITYGTLLCSDGAGNLTSFNNPAAPTAPVMGFGGTSATTNYTYGLVAVSQNGTFSTIVTTQTTSGNATLSATNYNTITATAQNDAVGWIVVRTASSGTPTAVGTIGFIQYPNTTFNDTGIAINPNTSATQFFARPAAPSAPTVVSGGTSGATTYTYKISAINFNGVWSTESTSGSATNANATLSATAYTTISWTLVAGAVLYAIDRTSAAGTPSTTGIIGFASPASSGGWRDTGFATLGTQAALVVTTPTPTPLPGSCLAVSLGVLAANTATATAVPVCMGGF